MQIIRLDNKIDTFSESFLKTSENVSFPRSYENFIKEFGHGLLGMSLLIHSPQEVVEKTIITLSLYDDLFKEYFETDYFTYNMFIESFELAINDRGNSIFYNKTFGETLLVIDRNDQKIYFAPQGFNNIFYWIDKEKNVVNNSFLESKTHVLFYPKEFNRADGFCQSENLNFRAIVNNLKSIIRNSQIIVLNDGETTTEIVLAEYQLQISLSRDLNTLSRTYLNIVYSRDKSTFYETLKAFFTSLGFSLLEQEVSISY